MTIEAELHDGTVLEFPDETPHEVIQATIKKTLKPQGPSAAERVANDPITKGAQAVLEADPADLAAANPAVRLGLGAVSPVLGAAQLVAKSLGIPDDAITGYIRNLEGMKQRGAAALSDPQEITFPSRFGGAMPPKISEGLVSDIGGAAEVAGNLAALGPLAKIAPAASVIGRIGQGAAIGGVAGATTPVTSEDYWGSKGGQVLLGTVLGGAIPGGIEAAKGIYGGARNIMDMFTPEGAKRILSRYQRQIVGEKNLPEVITALRGTQEIVPGTRPTAAEILSQVPSGSPIVAHQKVTASTPGGASAQFGQRTLDQATAIKEAEKYRDKVTKPLREDALAAANRGGVEPKNIVTKIDEILSDPQYATSDVASKALNAVKDKITEFTNNRGLIDAEALYAIRKNMGVTIGQFSKENAAWDRKMTAGLEKKLQTGIDTEIEKAIQDSGAGGNLWRRYLDEYATRSKNIEKVVERQETMYQPPQKTNLQGGEDVAGQMRVHGPQMLSRPMMATNFILKKMGESVEKRIDPEAAKRYLDPQALATELEKFTPALKRSVVQDLINRGYLPALGTTISQTQ